MVHSVFELLQYVDRLRRVPFGIKRSKNDNYFETFLR
jgi:hypothetical protein